MRDMTDLFEKYGDEFLKFDRVPTEMRLATRPDLCAFLLLHRLVPGTQDIIAAAEHDEIWLSVEPDALFAVATEDDIVTLIRCGVRYNSETDSLAMFA